MNNFAKVSEGGHLSLGEEHTCLKFMLENALGQGQMLIVTVLSCLRVCVCVCVCVHVCSQCNGEKIPSTAPVGCTYLVQRNEWEA